METLVALCAWLKHKGLPRPLRRAVCQFHYWGYQEKPRVVLPCMGLRKFCIACGAPSHCGKVAKPVHL